MDLKNKIQEHTNLINSLNTDLDLLINEWFLDDEEESDSDEGSQHDRLDKVQAAIDRLEKRLSGMSSAGLPFNKIWIRFADDVSLDIESLASPKFNRNLKGSMYFTVTNVNESAGVMYLKTKSFDDDMGIKLKFRTLETYTDQYGEVNLIYDKYGNLTSRDAINGNEKDVKFTITKKE